MTKIDLPTTTAVKEASDCNLSTHGVTSKHYHADNVLFDTEVFKSSIKLANQTLLFCGLSANYQNGKAERRIGDVTQSTGTFLIHASHGLPTTIHAFLCQSDMKHYCNRGIDPVQSSGGSWITYNQIEK